MSTVPPASQELATLRAEVRAQTADKRSLEADQDTLHKQMASLRSKQSKAEAQEKRLAEHERALHEREAALLERLTAPQLPPPSRQDNASSALGSSAAGSRQQPIARRSPRASSEVRAETRDLERGTRRVARPSLPRSWGGGSEQRRAPEAAWAPPPRLRASEDFFF